MSEGFWYNLPAFIAIVGAWLGMILWPCGVKGEIPPKGPVEKRGKTGG